MAFQILWILQDFLLRQSSSKHLAPNWFNSVNENISWWIIYCSCLAMLMMFSNEGTSSKWLFMTPKQDYLHIFREKRSDFIYIVNIINNSMTCSICKHLRNIPNLHFSSFSWLMILVKPYQVNIPFLYSLKTKKSPEGIGRKHLLEMR